MKNIALLLFLVFSLQSAFAQKKYIVKLKASEEIKIENRNFYIYKTSDRRIENQAIGTVHQGSGSAKVDVTFKSNLDKTFDYYLNDVLRKKSGYIPVFMEVIAFNIWDSVSENPQIAGVHLKVEFYSQNNYLWNFSNSLESTGADASKLHEENIKKILETAIRDFSASGWEAKLKLTENQNSNFDLPSQRIDDLPDDGNPRRRDVIAVGYQIGGYTLIGINYEFRMTDYLGLHAGVGFKGFTGGIKVHMGTKKNSPFINISYKDGGFGKLRVAAIEFGGRIPLSKIYDFALHGQIGVGNVFFMDGEIAKKVNNGAVPDYMLTFGIGFSI